MGLSSLISLPCAFSGPRKQPMTPQQQQAIVRVLNQTRPLAIANGCAEGCDEACLTILATMRLPILIDLHPAFAERRDIARKILSQYPLIGTIHPCRPPLVRNLAMLRTPTRWLLACAPPKARGGTFHTINEAHRLRLPVIVVRPSGKIERLAPPHLRKRT